ncbi:hypothetical protein D3C86_1164310 [compost metagenome]
MRGIRWAGRGKSEAQRAVFWALAGEAFWRAGRHAQASRHLQRAIDRLSTLGNRLELGRARFRLARAHQATGSAREAAEQAEEAAALFKALGARYDQRALSAWCHASVLASPASPEEVS